MKWARPAVMLKDRRPEFYGVLAQGLPRMHDWNARPQP
jgi:hypothetical protein